MQATHNTLFLACWAALRAGKDLRLQQPCSQAMAAEIESLTGPIHQQMCYALCLSFCCRFRAMEQRVVGDA